MSSIYNLDNELADIDDEINGLADEVGLYIPPIGKQAKIKSHRKRAAKLRAKGKTGKARKHMKIARNLSQGRKVRKIRIFKKGRIRKGVGFFGKKREIARNRLGLQPGFQKQQAAPAPQGRVVRIVRKPVLRRKLQAKPLDYQGPMPAAPVRPGFRGQTLPRMPGRFEQQVQEPAAPRGRPGVFSRDNLVRVPQADEGRQFERPEVQFERPQFEQAEQAEEPGRQWERPGTFRPAADFGPQGGGEVVEEVVYETQGLVGALGDLDDELAELERERASLVSGLLGSKKK